MGFRVGEVLRATAVPRNASEYSVRESGDASSAFRLGEIDRLGYRRVLGYATHIKNLVQADAERVPHASFYAFEPTLHSPIEQIIQPASEPLNTEHQLSAPRTVAGVE
jgi:hypothetical protein